MVLLFVLFLGNHLAGEFHFGLLKQEKLFLGENLGELIKRVKENELKVTGCERRVECRMGLGLPDVKDKDGNVKQRDMVGYIDMTLEDSKGHPVVFDFKWTSWTKGYQDKLTENRSTQLELYRMMLGQETRNGVERVAYFLMPEGRLYRMPALCSFRRKTSVIRQVP